MTVSDSLYSWLDYECLLCDWLRSDLRIGHFFSFRCPLVSTPQLNNELLRMPNDWTELKSEMSWVLCYDRRSAGQSVLE
jgi:hypothetical protein